MINRKLQNADSPEYPLSSTCCQTSAIFTISFGKSDNFSCALPIVNPKTNRKTKLTVMAFVLKLLT